MNRSFYYTRPAKCVVSQFRVILFNLTPSLTQYCYGRPFHPYIEREYFDISGLRAKGLRARATAHDSRKSSRRADRQTDKVAVGIDFYREHSGGGRGCSVQLAAPPPPTPPVQPTFHCSPGKNIHS